MYSEELSTYSTLFVNINLWCTQKVRPVSKVRSGVNIEATCRVICTHVCAYIDYTISSVIIQIQVFEFPRQNKIQNKFNSSNFNKI